MSTPLSPPSRSSSSRPRPPSRPGSGSASTSLAGRAAATPPSSAPRVLLYAQPASVHFGGFSLDASQLPATQRVFVHNNSAKPVRLQYTLPSGGVFRASFPQGRKPFLSPGLCEELLVVFTPAAFQYYYDCVQIKCEQVAYASNADAALLGKLLVPLHAYPVVNRVAFPSRMDFGAVPLGATAHRHVDLSCSVPIDFEFELRVVTPHAAFTIFPLSGTIPANGTTRIEFDFKPMLYATARAEVELLVSQLGFEPLPCVLAGSSASDVTEETAAPCSPTKRSQRSSTADPPTSPKAQAKGSPSSKSSSSSKPSFKQSPSKRSRGSSGESKHEMMNGVEIPADLSSMASVNFVLTQQPGKLKPKDLKKAIDANRIMRQQQKDEQAKLTLTVHAETEQKHAHDQHVLSPAVLSFSVLVQEETMAIQRASVGRPIREMGFLQELAEIETIEKELEFQSHKIRLGQALLTPVQLEILRHMRDLNARTLERREREKLRNDFTTRAFHASTPPTAKTPYPPRGALPAHFEPAMQPDFKNYKNDLWERRKRVVLRLVRAISTVILRNRAQSRLEKIQKWLGRGSTREQVRDRVAKEWQQIAQGGDATTTATTTTPSQPRAQSTTTTASANSSRIYFNSFPMVEETDRHARDPITLSPRDWDLETDPFAFFPLREREEALVTGHEPLELPPLATYVPLENTRELRRGALDECSRSIEDEDDDVMVPCLPQQELRMPTTLEMLPRDVFLRPSAAVRPFVRVHAMRETLVWFPLRPQRVFRSTPRHWGLVLDTGLGTRSLRSRRTGLLRLSERYQPRTERSRGPSPLLLCGQQSSEVVESTRGSVEKDLYRSVWDASDGFVPPLSSNADDVPCLSDSESDDDGEEKTYAEEKTSSARGSRARRAAIPTWQDAQRLWEEDNDDEEDDGVAYEPGEVRGKAQGIPCFERYRHLIQSEREYNVYRDEKLQQLPTLLSEVASKIHEPDYKLVVEGHGPSRPLHEPFTKALERTQATTID